MSNISTEPTTEPTIEPAGARRRPLSVPHLVFGVVFVGIAAIRFIGEGTDADLPRSAIGFPVVLIGAGIVGLVATVINARRRSRPEVTPEESPEESPEVSPEVTEETTVLEENER